MSPGSGRERQTTSVIVAVLAVAAVVALVVGGSRWLSSQSPSGEVEASAAGASSVSETVDYDEDIHSLPSPTGSPADPATMTPPPPDPPIDMRTAFQTGIGEGAPPMPSVVFRSQNYWNGWFHGQPLSVFAGSPGYEHMSDGAVMVITYELDGGYDQTWTRVLKGVGTLTIVRGTDDGTVELVNDKGDHFVYDLKTRQLHPA